MKAFTVAFTLLVATAVAEPAKDTAFGEPRRDGPLVAQLVSERAAIAPGEELHIALRLMPDEGCHTYWKAPGLVGVPTVIEWTAKPSGIEIGKILWPQPQRVQMGPYDANGYKGETFLVVPITASKGLAAREPLNFSCRVSFMCCAKVCHPGFIDLQFQLPVSDKPSAETVWAKKIQAALDSRAVSNTIWQAEASRDTTHITLKLSPAKGKTTILPEIPYFFSADGQVDSDIEQIITRDGKGITLKMALSEFGPENPPALHGIFYSASGKPDKTGAVPIRFTVPYLATEK